MAMDKIVKYKPPVNEIRMVLLGKTGNGKSKTGNSILGQPSAFSYGCYATSLTQECLWLSETRFGRKLDVVDTPGVFDTDKLKTNTVVQTEIKRCISLTTPGPHAILLCVKMQRFTQEDTGALDHFLRYFGKELLNYSILIFTCFDQWEEDNREDEKRRPLTTEEYIKNLPPFLSKFIQDIKGRYLFFNNRLKGHDIDRQIENLLMMIDEIKKENQNSCYTSAMYEKVEKLLQQEVERTGLSRDEVKESKTFFEKVSELLGNMVQRVKSIIFSED